MEISLCHYAGYGQEITNQIVNFIEYLMNKVDYTDEQAVIMIYGLYKISREKNGVLDNLKEFISSKSVVSKPIINTIKNNPTKEFIEVKKDSEKINKTQIKETNKKVFPAQEYAKSTREVMCFSGITILLGILSFISLIVIFITMWKLNLLTNITRIYGAGLIFITIELFLLSKLFSKKNKISKLKAVEEIASLDLEEETVLLSFTNKDQNFKLHPEDAEKYQDIAIVEFPFFIGKLKTKVNCSIDNAAVSRFHAKIELQNEKYYITDLNSTNGTFLNNIRLEPNETKELHIGEKISFANVSYFFEKI